MHLIDHLSSSILVLQEKINCTYLYTHALIIALIPKMQTRIPEAHQKGFFGALLSNPIFSI